MSQHLIPKYIKELKVYTPGKQPRKKNNNIIKLNTNENPYSVPSEIKRWFNQFPLAELSYYPDPNKTELVDELSRFFQLNSEHFAVGNGSDELIAAVFRAFLLFADESSRKVILTEYTYGAYRYYAYQYQIPIEVLPMSEEFEILSSDMVENLNRFAGRVFFLTNPNAPTGIFLDWVEIEQICQKFSDKLIIVDETYIDFANGMSSVPLIKQYHNLIILRTFSKSFSTCGMRLGFAVGSPPIITALKKVLDPYNVNLFAQKIGLLLLKNFSKVKRNIEKVIETREKFKNALEDIGFSTLPSQTNFVMTTMKPLLISQYSNKSVRGNLIEKKLVKETRSLFRFLEEKYILVRYFDEPFLNQYLRISIGTDRDMETVIRKIKSFIRLLRKK